MKFQLFSQVALREDIPKYGLKKGTTATIVEHYQMPEGEEDSYSLEGFNLEAITVEVAESQIQSSVGTRQWRVPTGKLWNLL